VAAVPTEPADPPVACTLQPEDLPDRVREWQRVLRHAEERRTIPDGIELRFPRDPELVASLAELATKEVACCAFFSFTLSIDANAAWISVAAPVDGVPLVRALFGANDA
jgi:hypothetical protein